MPRAAERPIVPGGNVPLPMPAEFPLLAYADGVMGALRQHVPKALGERDAEAIHQARVATRRMKAALDLLRPVLSEKRRRPLARVLRKLRRRLGPLRDADVMLEHLAEMHASPKSAAAATWLADAVGSQRQALRDASERDAPSAEVLDRLAAWLPVRNEIARARDATDPLISESVHRQLDAFAQQAGRLATPPADPAAEAQNPHELRISGKALRYTLEMALVQGHALPKRVMKSFKQMQELLGAWHDYVVLTDQALKSSLDLQLGHHDASRQEQVLDLARFTNRRAGQHLAAFRKLWSSTGEDVAAAIRAAIGPPTASGSGTDPGRNGSAAPAGPAVSPPASPSAAS